MTQQTYNHGVLAYNAPNIGDEIQSLASMRFLPSVDEYIYRERIRDFVPQQHKQTKCIMNAWWIWDAAQFPPPDSITPLLVSMHFQSGIRDSFLTEKTREYLIKHGPVGCRDQESCEWLQENGVDAYFSGCLTLTLQRNDSLSKEDYVLCVDVPERVVELIRERTKRPVYTISRRLAPHFDLHQRFEVARCVLAMFQKAHCVVSPCLHVINPCLALETPVLRILVDNEYAIDMDKRYRGLESFYHSLSYESLAADAAAYDFDNPPENPQEYLKVRNTLIERCKAFTGYESAKSPIPDNINIGLTLHQCNTFNYEQIVSSLYYASPNDLLEVLLLRISGVTPHHLEFGKLNKRPKWVKLNAVKWLLKKMAKTVFWRLVSPFRKR